MIMTSHVVDFLHHVFCGFGLPDRLFFFESAGHVEITYVNDYLPMRPTRRIIAKIHAMTSGINILESIGSLVRHVLVPSSK